MKSSFDIFIIGGGINGAGHYYGYRNFETQDASINLIPLAFFIGGPIGVVLFIIIAIRFPLILIIWAPLSITL